MIDFFSGLFDRLSDFMSVIKWLLFAAAVILLLRLVAAVVRYATEQLGRVWRLVHGTAAKSANLAWSSVLHAWEWLYSTIQSIDVAIRNGWRLAFAAVHSIAVHESGRRRIKTLFRGSPASVKESAAERRRFLRELERAHSSSSELLEEPPGWTRPTRQEAGGLRSPSAQAAIQARRRWELSDDALVLHARVTDTVLCILGITDGDSEEGFPDFDVALRKRRWWECRVGESPWIVEIGIDDGELLRPHLLRLQEWLGISVAMTKPLRFSLHSAACGATACGSVGSGTIAGAIERGDECLLMTCAHVEPPKCSQVMVRGDYAVDPSQPDVVLLRSAPDCGHARRPRTALIPAKKSEIDDLRDRDQAVRRVGGASHAYEGRVEYIGFDSYRIGPNKFRFPAMVVRLRHKWYFWVIPWPLFRQRFSAQGDSGSLVVGDLPGEKQKRVWLGMLHGGKKLDSLVICAEPLVNYLDILINEGRKTLTAHQLNGR